MDWSHIKANSRPHDERDLILGAAAAPAAMPASYIPDLSWIKRNFQGKTYFCGEHAGSHLKAILDYVMFATAGRKTPRYGAIKLKDPKSPVCDGFPIDAGTDMRSIFKWLQKLGAADYEPLENDVTLSHPQYCNPAVVTPEIDANAATSKIANYAFGNTDFNSLCQYAWSYKAVLLLIKCDDGLWGTSTPTFTNTVYGHFVTQFGYDANNIYVVDSAEPNDAFAIKKIGKQYITPKFFLESGTAIDLPPSAKAVLASTTIPAATKPQIIQQIITDLAEVVGLIKEELGQAKVAT